MYLFLEHKNKEHLYNKLTKGLNMKNLTKTILSALFLFTMIAPAIALASGQHTVVGKVKHYKVTEYQNGDAYLIIDMDADSANYGTLPACATKNNRFALALDSAMIDQVTSIVMTAHISGLNLALKSPLPEEGQQCLEETQRLALINVKPL